MMPPTFSTSPFQTTRPAGRCRYCGAYVSVLDDIAIAGHARFNQQRDIWPDDQRGRAARNPSRDSPRVTPRRRMPSRPESAPAADG